MSSNYVLLTDYALLDDQEYPTPDAALAIMLGQIIWAGTRLDLPDMLIRRLPAMAVSGAFLLPGLIDAHVHLGFDGSADPVSVMRASDDPALLKIMLESARRQLVAGVTTVRDAGARGYLDVTVAELTASRHALGPRIVSCGVPITSPNGHCHFMGGECADGAHIAAHIRRNREAGTHFVKVMATGGFMTSTSRPGAPQFSLDQLAEVVENSHRLGMRVAAHAHGTYGIRDSVNAGCDTIEHCTWVGDGGLDYDRAVAHRMVQLRTAVCPTVNSNARNPKGRVPW
ncbi:MAG: amidohydrolase family protein, partial [Chloroflexota bacterium]